MKSRLTLRPFPFSLFIGLRFSILCVALSFAPFAAAQLQPFTLPWNDRAPTITDLSGLNTPIPLSSGWITPNADGHLMRAGKRERILGVNIGADAAFPRINDADAIAARLAKFGFNSVRFHHLEAPWAPNNVLLDYRVNSSNQPIGRSRQLNTDRLNRLHHFVARLADHGIYANLNLLVSRQFFPDDGFPSEISQLEWKAQQALSFFDPHMMVLQKEHASNLLTAPNPWRHNTPLRSDPAVAFVEILNEYGYLQAWHDGTLDVLPSVFATTYRDHWNTWLATRYPSTAALLTAWAAIDESLGPQLLTNADFASGATSWNFEQHQNAVASNTSSSDFTGNKPALTIQVTTAGEASWHVQLNQAGLSLVAGQIYTASFSARSADALPLHASITRAGPADFGSVASIATPTLTPSWQRFTASFVASSDEPTTRFNFNGFGHLTGTVQIADVSFTTGGQAGTLPANTSLESRNIPPVPKQGSANAATPAQIQDWFRYLLASDRAYWREMYRFIHDDIDYPGVVFGTIGVNSPPGIQAELDAVDSHFYWQHPNFPGDAWDQTNWTIPNTSMVNNLTSHFGLLAGQRVKGKPFFCSEYQHPSPGTYSGEGPLMAGAYAALQDWDGIWFFDYGDGVDDWDRGFISGFFAMDTHPSKMANHLLAATLFRRGDLSPAHEELVIGFDAEAQLNATSKFGSAWQVGDARHLGLSNRQALESRIALDPHQPLGPLPTPPAGSTMTADNGQLIWDLSRPDQGILSIDTPRTKAILGYPASRPFALDQWTIQPGTTRHDWLSVGITLIEGESLQSPAGFRALVIATGDVENTGQQWTDATKTSLGTAWGSSPTLIEVVPATIDLPFPASRVSAWALDPTGAKNTPVPVNSIASGTRLQFGHSGSTLWYEIAVTPDPSVVEPQVSLHPNPRLLAPGVTATLKVEALGALPLTYQWLRNGAPLASTNSPTLTLSAVTPSDSGTYAVLITNAHGNVTSRAAKVIVTANPAPSTGLLNLSTRTNTGAGSAALTPGFVLAGSGRKEVLIRAVGPGLAQFGLTQHATDPSITLYQSAAGATTQIAANDDWSSTAIGDAFTRAGAFAITPDSADAALLTSIGSGVYSAPVVDEDHTGGVAIVELYDLANTDSNLRIRNLSARGFVSTRDNPLVAGFVIPGDTPRRVLIRAIGPTLGAFGVEGVLADPELEIVQLSATNAHQRLAANADWFRATNAAAIAANSKTLGAFPLGPTARDSAVLVELDPGVYSAIVRGSGNTTGIALVEIYEVD